MSSMNTMCDMCCCGLWQDMACDTFLKIVQKCKRKFVTQQVCSRIFPKYACTWCFFFYYYCLKSEPLWLVRLVQSTQHDLQMLFILFSCCFTITNLKFMHMRISISSIDLCQVLIFTFAHFSFNFHVVSLVLNSCISISSVDLRQVLIFTFAHFLQVGENEPFVSELLSNLATTIADLEPHQIHTFYESVCWTQTRKIWSNKIIHHYLLFKKHFLCLLLRLAIWFKLNLTTLRGMNTSRDWWAFLIRFLVLYSIMHFGFSYCVCSWIWF